MAEKKEKASAGLKHTFYKADASHLERTRQSCPKCGPGTFLAQHDGRTSCGRCGYTEFAKK
jgi:small subunit ribosomal protein S27Ae